MTRHQLRLTAPATGFVDAFPIGNGTLGAMVHGRPGSERLDLNIDTLWSGGPLPTVSAERPNPAAAERLARLRRTIRSGDFVAADTHAEGFQVDAWTQSYQPVGWLEWLHAPAEAGGYERVLDLATAEVVTRYRTAGGPVVVRSFVSAPDEVIVVSVTGAGASGLDLASPTLGSPHPGVEQLSLAEPGRAWLIAAGRAPTQVIPIYVPTDPAVFYADDEPDEHGTVAAGMGFALAAAAEQRPAETRLLIAMRTGFRGYRQRPSADLDRLRDEARTAVDTALARSTENLRDRHLADYRGYFDRVDLDLAGSQAVEGSADPAAAELLFDMGRHLLISSSRPGTQAANLQGIWNTDVRPGWSSNYTTNINVQMNYWGAESLSLPELHVPLADLVGDLVAAGRSTAAAFYDAAGSVTHHNTDLWRFTAAVHGQPVWANWPSALNWMSAHLWDRLEFASIEDPAQRSATLEVFSAAAAFALDLLVPDDDGTLVWSPSTSPENTFLTADGQTAAVSEGGGMDQELVRELLSRFLALAQDGDADSDLVGRANQALDEIRPIGTGPLGLLEWMDQRSPAEPGHRHLSHLYGVYPGTRISESGTPADFAAARTALKARLDAGSGHTGWSQAWVLCLAARLRDSELADRSIRDMLDKLVSPTLLDLHPYGAPGEFIFQIDGNLGVIAGMAELLVQSHDGAVSLLRALPPSWSHGCARGLRTRGGHVVELDWADRALIDAQVSVGRPGKLVLEVPAETGELQVVGDGNAAVELSETLASEGRRRFAWAAPTSGEVFRVTVASQSGLP